MKNQQEFSFQEGSIHDNGRIYPFLIGTVSNRMEAPRSLRNLWIHTAVDCLQFQQKIKQFHYELKSGVFEDRANGYAIGDYKKRPNMIGLYETTLPGNVVEEMAALLSWYENREVTLEVLARFHVRYESIHPFQDGNGRTGRLILFRECLRHNVSPFIIEDAHQPAYLETLKEYRETGAITKLVTLFRLEQDYYWQRCRYFAS